MLPLNLKKKLRTGASMMVGALVVGITVGQADVHADFNGQPAGGCYLTERLKDSRARFEFVDRVAGLRKGNGGNGHLAGGYPEIVKASYPTMESGTLDPFSFECLSCHDGSSAPLTGFSHPVGVPYPAYSRNGRYVSKGSLNRRIVLIDGKVGCLSCHNPLNPAKFHLVMSNDRSNLCFACHIN